MPRKADTTEQSWSPQLLPLVVFIALGSLIAYGVPALPNSTAGLFGRLQTIGYHQVVALVLLCALTVIFLSYYRAMLFFSTRWLLAAVIYNSLILFVKFTLSTHELTLQLNNSFSSIMSTAMLVSLLYIFAFTVLYLFFDGRVLNRGLHKALITSGEGKVLLAMGLFICATLARILLFRLPLLSGSAASGYVSDIFKTNSVLLSGLLFVMILAAVEAYAQVRRRVDLKYFFVTGLVLILTFHFWWALFVYRGY